MNKKSDNSDFEIQFYEGVLEKKGNFTEALAALGDLYTKKGMFQKGLVIDLKLSLLRPDDPVVLYNLACSYSLLNEIDLAYRTIKKAVSCGYSDFAHMQLDQDLANLRSDSRFTRFFQRMTSKSLDYQEPVV